MQDEHLSATGICTTDGAAKQHQPGAAHHQHTMDTERRHAPLGILLELVTKIALMTSWKHNTQHRQYSQHTPKHTHEPGNQQNTEKQREIGHI